MMPYHNKLSEEVLHALEDILVFYAFCLLEVGLLGEFLYQIALLTGEVIGDCDIHNNHNIATAIAIYIGDTLSTKTKHLACVSTRGNLDTSLAIDSRHLNLATEDCGSYGNI